MSNTSNLQLPSLSRYTRRRMSQAAKPFAVLLKPLSRLFTRRRLLIAGSAFAAFLIITPILTYSYYARAISDPGIIMNRKEKGIVLKDRGGQVFYRRGNIDTTDNLKLEQISDTLEQAVIASEDKSFYEHEGFSVKGIARAVYTNARQQDATGQGGSTITQQLVKNQLLTPDKNLVRKYQEVSMAIALEQKYEKHEILEMYLNTVYFGEGTFGIHDAAKYYFGKLPSDLTLAESSMLAGLLPAPNLYSPISGDAKLAAEQQDRVLRNMVEMGTISEEQRQQALAQPLQYAGGPSDSLQHAQHFALMVIEQLRDHFGESWIIQGGFEVTTTLDLDQQKQAEKIVRDNVSDFHSRGGRNAALVAIEPASGEIRALAGSVDWSNQEYGKVNMAVTPRQPGSAFKPIYYAEAIDKGLITGATIIKDEETTFGDWTPANYDLRYRGDVTARTALALSLNIPAAKVMEKLGPEQAAQAAQRMGISTVTDPQSYGLTLSLGTAETKLLEMTNAYAAFASHGRQYEPSLIRDVKDKYGKLIYEQLPGRNARQVISPEAAFITTSILSDTEARAPTFGSSLNLSGRPAAVKTGTTNDNKDAWTIGYTPDLAIGVWVGNNEHEPMRGLVGGSSAGVIWRQSMNALLAGSPPKDFKKPAGVVRTAVCKESGLKASFRNKNTYDEYFIRGREPAGECRPPKREQDRRERKEQKDRKQEEHRGREENEDPASPTPVEEPVQLPAPAPAEQQPVREAYRQPADIGGRGGGPRAGPEEAEDKKDEDAEPKNNKPDKLED